MLAVDPSLPLPSPPLEEPFYNPITPTASAFPLSTSNLPTPRPNFGGLLPILHPVAIPIPIPASLPLPLILPAEALTPSTAHVAMSLSPPRLSVSSQPEGFPFADFPLEPSSPTSVIKRRRWVRPSERTAAGPSAFAQRMAGLRPLRPCLVSRKQQNNAGGSETSSAVDGGSEASTPSLSKSPEEFTTSPISSTGHGILGGGLLESPIRGGFDRAWKEASDATRHRASAHTGADESFVWTPVLPSPPADNDLIHHFAPLSLAAMGEPGTASGSSSATTIRPALPLPQRQESSDSWTDESGEVEDYMLRGLYGSRGAIKVDELAMNPLPVYTASGPALPAMCPELGSSLTRMAIPSGMDILSSSAASTSTITPWNAAVLPPTPVSIIAAPTAPLEGGDANTPNHHPIDDEYNCEYEYLCAISAFQAQSAQPALSRSNSLATSSSGMRSRSSTETSGAEGDVEVVGDDRPRKRGARVHFPMCPERKGEVALCVLFPTYSPSEYDRTPLEPPSEEERSCRLPERGSRCIVDEVDVANMEGSDSCPDANGMRIRINDEGYWETGAAEAEGEQQEEEVAFDMDCGDAEVSTPKPAERTKEEEDASWEDWLDQRQKRSPRPGCSPKPSCGGLFSRFTDYGDGAMSTSPTYSHASPLLAPPALSIVTKQPSSGILDYVDFKVPSPKQLTFEELCKQDEMEGVASDTPSLTSTITASSTCLSTAAAAVAGPSSSKGDVTGVTCRLADIDLNMEEEERQNWLPHPVAKPASGISSPSRVDSPCLSETGWETAPDSDAGAPVMKAMKPLKKPRKKKDKDGSACRASVWASRLCSFSNSEFGNEGFGSNSSGFGTPEDDGVLGGF